MENWHWSNWWGKPPSNRMASRRKTRKRSRKIKSISPADAEGSGGGG